MNEHTTPNLSTYRAVHRGLRITPHRLAAVAVELEPADRDRRRALGRFWKGFASEVLTHHTLEDEVFFPALVERVPVARELIARTDRDHAALDDLMETCDAAVAAVVAGSPATDRLAVALSDLAELMDRHLDLEDADILPLFERHFSADEYHAIDTRAMKSLRLSRQTGFAIAFVTAHMTPEVLRDALSGAPAPFRVLYRLARRPYDRLGSAVFGDVAQLPQAVA